jgi:hypothetical protein
MLAPMIRSPFPVADRATFGHFGGSLVEQPHVGDLVLRRDPAPLPLAALSAGTQLAGDRAEDPGEQRLIDGLRASPHHRIVRERPLQEPRDLWRRPPPAQLVSDRLPQRRADQDPLPLRPSPA